MSLVQRFHCSSIQGKVKNKKPLLINIKMKFLTSGGSGYSELSYGFLRELRVGGGRGGAYEALDNLIGQFRDGHLNVTGLEGEGDCGSCN